MFRCSKLIFREEVPRMCKWYWIADVDWVWEWNVYQFPDRLDWSNLTLFALGWITHPIPIQLRPNPPSLSLCIVVRTYHLLLCSCHCHACTIILHACEVAFRAHTYFESCGHPNINQNCTDHGGWLYWRSSATGQIVLRSSFNMLASCCVAFLVPMVNNHLKSEDFQEAATLAVNWHEAPSYVHQRRV